MDKIIPLVMPQLCLGSAQFGMNYGITNVQGKVPTDQLREILHIAAEYSISYIDTAKMYGDAEKRLGDNAPCNYLFKYITKLPAQGGSFWGSQKVKIWEDSFDESLTSLNVRSIDTLLLHSVIDLRHNESNLLVDWLLSLKERGKVMNVGVSIYNSNDLKGLDLSVIDVIQLPLSIYDQRCLHDGTLDFLYSKNIKVFARSIFLQGLILTNSAMWPSHINANFVNHHQKWLDMLESISLSPLEGVFSFMRSIDQLSGIIVGINSLNQFKEILNAWSCSNSNSNYSRLLSTFQWPNEYDIDPRKWPIS